MMASVVLAQQQPGTASVLLPVVATQPGGKPDEGPIIDAEVVDDKK